MKKIDLNLGIEQQDTKIFSKKNNIDFTIQAYFVDLDGTTLDKKISKLRVSKKNIEAINEKQKKYPVIISTGRSYGPKVKKLMEFLNIKYAICQNGAVIVNSNGEILRNIELTIEQKEMIFDIAKNNKLFFTINSQKKVYTSHILTFFLRLFLRKKFVKLDKFNPNEKVNKVVYGGRFWTHKIVKIFEEIKHTIPNVSAKVSGHDLIIELTHKNATKGLGAKWLCEYLNIDISKTVHIGDSENDSTTIEYVGALIAMKNSSNRLKKHATHIGPHFKRGGLAKVLNGHFKEI